MTSYRFTHAVDFLARAVIANALFKGRQKASALTIPYSAAAQSVVAHREPNRAGAGGIEKPAAR
jgi:hypothetical protein